MSKGWPGKYFRPSEFACSCGRCSMDKVKPELVKVLDKAREHLGVPLRINSGVRCDNHNLAVGGVSTSLHLGYPLKGKVADRIGFAADVTYSSAGLRNPLNMCRLYMALESFGRPISLGLGLYPSFVHVDVRGLQGRKAARWADRHFGWGRLHHD